MVASFTDAINVNQLLVKNKTSVETEEICEEG
jgi:hypothetical protein